MRFILILLLLTFSNNTEKRAHKTLFKFYGEEIVLLKTKINVPNGNLYEVAGKTDKEMGNGLMLIMLSQSFCAIPPTIRQNCDFTLCTSLANRLERKKIVDEYFTLYSSRFGLD